MGKGNHWGDDGWQVESARSPDEQATDANGASHGLSAHQAVAMENTVGASCTDPDIPYPEKGGLASSPASNARGLRKSSSMREGCLLPHEAVGILVRYAQGDVVVITAEPGSAM